jgi:hypothetical protein
LGVDQDSFFWSSVVVSPQIERCSSHRASRRALRREDGVRSTSETRCQFCVVVGASMWCHSQLWHAACHISTSVYQPELGETSSEDCASLSVIPLYCCYHYTVQHCAVSEIDGDAIFSDSSELFRTKTTGRSTRPATTAKSKKRKLKKLGRPWQLQNTTNRLLAMPISICGYRQCACGHGAG